MAGDHIQIPKSVLRGFCDKNKKVYTMDMNKNIEHKLISDVNAEVGYYAEYVEKQILKTREDAFGRVKKAIKSFIKGKETVVLSKKNNDIVLDYFNISLLRSEEMIHDINKESITMHLIDEKPQNIVLAYYDNEIFKNVDLFSNLYFNVMINETNVDFVIPQKQFYSVFQKDGTYFFIMPISPKVAITLQKDFKKFIVDDKVMIQKVLEDEYVDILNIRAIKEEFEYNKKMVFAKKRETLERYIDYINQKEEA